MVRNPEAFIEQGLSPLSADGAPPGTDPKYVYSTSPTVFRLALIDPDVPPPAAGMTYFAQTTRTTKYGATGRPLKKPRTTIVPGAAPGTVAFLDYTPLGDGFYINYITVRPDLRGRGAALRLATAFYAQIVIPRGAVYVNWGKVMNEGAWAVMQKMKSAFPNISTSGSRYF